MNNAEDNADNADNCANDDHMRKPDGFTEDEWEAGIYMQAYPLTADGQREFISKGLILMRHELDCIIGHAAADEWVEIVLHLSSDIEGMKAMFSAILSYLIEPDEAALVMATLTKAKMESETGVPMEVIEVAKGVYGLVVDAKAAMIPDTMEGFDNNE